MDSEMRPAVRYQPRYCTILGKYVWAITTRQSDGSWKIVNCLDKDEACFSLDCAFTTDQGVWPYRLLAGERLPAPRRQE